MIDYLLMVVRRLTMIVCRQIGGGGRREEGGGRREEGGGRREEGGGRREEGGGRREEGGGRREEGGGRREEGGGRREEGGGRREEGGGRREEGGGRREGGCLWMCWWTSKPKVEAETRPQIGQGTSLDILQVAIKGVGNVSGFALPSWLSRERKSEKRGVRFC